MTNTPKLWIASLRFIQTAGQARIFRASIEVYRRADTGPWRAAIEKILTNEPGSEKDPFVAGQRYTLALYDRDWDAAGRACGRCFPRRIRSSGAFRNLAATFGWV